VPKLSTVFAEVLSRAHGNSEEQSRVLAFSTIIISYCIIIIITDAYYNYIINA
jgi:hypothetical protein